MIGIAKVRRYRKMYDESNKIAEISKEKNRIYRIALPQRLEENASYSAGSSKSQPSFVPETTA